MTTINARGLVQTATDVTWFVALTGNERSPRVIYVKEHSTVWKTLSLEKCDLLVPAYIQGLFFSWN